MNADDQQQLLKPNIMEIIEVQLKGVCLEDRTSPSRGVSPSASVTQALAT